MEGVSGLLTEVAKWNCQDKLGRVWFHRLHRLNPSALKMTIAGAVEIVVIDMTKLYALVLYMTAFLTTPARVFRIFGLPVTPYRRFPSNQRLVEYLEHLDRVGPWCNTLVDTTDSKGH
ncbi:hypothetical protein R1flu_021958 [Riccia fluitans]|uniref:Uncharacterized protein n=1 Tax=Riccia fluitans TaxID=41844 RepID=A0ABD1ZR70_9MARC